MLNILKILIQAVAAIWPLLKKHPKKSLVAAAGITTASMFYSGGVTNPPSAVPIGAVTNHPGSDGDALTSNGDYTFTWEAGGGGGGGLDITGTVGDGDLLAYDGTDNTYRPQAWFQNVKSMVGGRRAAGVSAQTTGTGTAASTSLVTADGSSYEAGHGVAVIGAGASHGLSAPTNCFAIPRTVYQDTPITDDDVAAVTWTANTTTDRLILPNEVDCKVGLAIPNGQRVRFSNQGGALPTYDDGTPAQPITEGTNYYLAHAPEVRTLAIGNTPTSGTYRLHSFYDKRNPDFHIKNDPLLYVDIPYNSGPEVQTVRINGSPTGGSFTITIPGYGTTGSIAYNASAGTVQTAIQAVAGLGSVTVTSSGTLPSAVTYTISLLGISPIRTVMTSTSSLTGGTPSITHAITEEGFETRIRRLPGFAQVTAIQSGTSPNFTHTITFTGVPGAASLVYDTTNILPITTTITITQTTAGGYTIHTSEADAIAGSNALDLDGSGGSGTHHLEVYGSKTYDFRAAAQSGSGGVSPAASTFSTSLGPQECDEHQQICIAMDNPAGTRGFAVWGDLSTDYRLLALCNAVNNVYRVNLAAGGYTNFKAGDIGRTLTNGSTQTGTIQCFDNTTRNVWVIVSDNDTFPTNGATLSTTSGTGGGTQSGAAVKAGLWIYNGRRFKREYNYYANLTRRSGEKCYPGQLSVVDGYLYRCLDVTSDRRRAPEITFTINTSANTLTMSSTASLGALYLRASVALPATSTGRLDERTRYWPRTVSGSTVTIHPTEADATNNTNAIDLTAEGIGTYYALAGPSYSTTVGAVITDGNTTWRREDICVPRQPPDAEIANALLAMVVSRSSNTLTLDTALTTSVTSALVLHDDTDALLGHWNVVKSASSRSAVMYFPVGEYSCFLLDPLVDTRLFNSTFGSGTNYYLFRHVGTNHAWLNSLWKGEVGTRVIFNGTCVPGSLDNGDDSQGYGLLPHSFGRCRPVFEDIKWCSWPTGVQAIEHYDGSGGERLYGYDVDSTAGSGVNVGSRVDGPRFRGGGLYGFSVVGASTWVGNEATAERFEDFDAFIGGSNHNMCFYINGGVLRDVRAYRIRAEGSMGIYQDSSDSVPLLMDNCYFEGWRKNGAVAVRGDGFRCVNSTFVDCVQLFSREWVDGFYLDNCELYETNVTPYNSTNNGSRGVFLNNLRMVDCSLQIGDTCSGVRVNNVNIIITARPRRQTSSTASAATLDGTGQDITNLSVDNRAGSLTSNSFRSISFQGAGSNTFTRCAVTYSSGTWGTFTVSDTGSKVFDKCEFYTHNGSTTPCLFQDASDQRWTGCKFNGRSGTYEVAAGGRMEWEDCSVVSGIGLRWTSAVTGPLYIRNNDSFLGTITIQEPGAIYEDNNSAAAPTISSATNLATKGNRVADALELSPSALSSGNNNDYALGVTDTHRLDPNASNSTLTSIVARAGGTRVTIICVDAGAATLTILDDDGATGTAANRIVTPTGADIVLSNNESVVLQYDATSQRWKVVGGGYSSIWNRDAREAFSGNWSLAA